MILDALAATGHDLLIGLAFTFITVLFAFLLRSESHAPEREREPVEPVDFRDALRVRDKTRRGPSAEDFTGKTKIGRRVA